MEQVETSRPDPSGMAARSWEMSLRLRRPGVLGLVRFRGGRIRACLIAAPSRNAGLCLVILAGFGTGGGLSVIGMLKIFCVSAGPREPFPDPRALREE